MGRPVLVSTGCWDRMIVILLILLLGLPSFFMTRDILSAIFFPYDLLNAVEITMVAEAKEILAGRRLHVDPTIHLPFVTQAYFHGYPSLLAVVLAVWPAPIVAPRLFGALAHGLFAFMLFRAARLAGLSRPAALVASLLPLLLQSDGQNIANRTQKGPLFLATVGALLSMQCALQSRRLFWIGAAVLCAVGATWFHQTGMLAVAFLAVGLWPLGKRFALGAAGLGLVLAGGSLFFMNIASDGWFHALTVGSFRRQPIRLQNWIATLTFFRDRHLLLFPLLVWGAWKEWRDRSSGFFPWTAMAILYLPIVTFTSGMAGSGPGNIYIILPATGLLAGRFWDEGMAWSRRYRWIPLALIALYLLVAHRPSWRVHPSDFDHGERLSAYVQSAVGPVLTDRHLGLIIREGPQAEADVARLWELWRYADREPIELTRRISERHYALIMTSWVYEPTPVRKAIGENYVEIDRISSKGDHWYDFRIFTPRPDTVPTGS